MGCTLSRDPVDDARSNGLYAVTAEEHHVLKVLLLGPSGAGKRTLLQRLSARDGGDDPAAQDNPRLLAMDELREIEFVLKAPGGDLVLEERLAASQQVMRSPDLLLHVLAPLGVGAFLKKQVCRAWSSAVCELGLEVTQLKFSLGGSKIRIYSPSNAMQDWLVAPPSDAHQWADRLGSVADGVIFVASLAEYTLHDDAGNALEAQRKHFEIASSLLRQATNGRGWQILLLNKMDLFASKLSSTPLRVWNSDAPDSQNSHECVEFVKQRFLAAVPGDIHTHDTCLTGSKSIVRTIGNSITAQVLQGNLREANLI